MSTLNVSTIVPDVGTNTDLSLDGKGTGVPDLGAGFKVGGTAGVPVSALRAGTDGELITWAADASATTVPVGTATHVLTSNGAGAAPTFQAAGGGASTLIATLTPSGTSTTNLNFTGFDAAVYDHYVVSVQNIQPNGSGPDGQRFRMLSSSNGGSSYDTGSGYYGKFKFYHHSTGRAFQHGYNDESYIEWFGGFTTTHTGSDSGFNGHITIWSAGESASSTIFHFDLTARSNANAFYMGGGQYIRHDVAIVNAVRFYWNGQNFGAGGSIKVYGIKKT